jgi:hypothetical protein
MEKKLKDGVKLQVPSLNRQPSSPPGESLSSSPGSIQSKHKKPALNNHVARPQMLMPIMQMPQTHLPMMQPMQQSMVQQPVFYDSFSYTGPSTPGYFTNQYARYQDGYAMSPGHSMYSPIPVMQQSYAQTAPIESFQHNQIPIDKLVDKHSALVGSAPQQRRPGSIYNHESRFDNYFVMRDFFRNRYLFRDSMNGMTIDAEFWLDLLRVGVDMCTGSAPFLHRPTFINNPFSLGESFVATIIGYAIIGMDGSTSQEHYTSATNNRLSMYLIRRVMSIVERYLVTITSAETVMSTLMSLVGTAVLFIVLDRRNIMTERYMAMAVVLARELKHKDLSPLHCEIAIRAKWLIFCVDRAGGVASSRKLMPEDIVEYLNLPHRDAEFQRPRVDFLETMPTLAECLTPETLELYFDRLDPFAIVLIVFRMQDLILAYKAGISTRSKAELERMMQYLERKIQTIPVSNDLSSNDPMELHPGHVLMQCYLTWTYLYLPNSVHQLVSDEWTQAHERDFNESMHIIGLAAAQLASLINKLDFCSLSPMPIWIFPCMVKITLIYTVLVCNVKETSDEWVDDLVARCKAFVIGLRYAALTDRSLNTVSDLLEHMIGEGDGGLAKGAFGAELTHLLLEKFPLLESGTMPPEFIEFILPVTSSKPGKLSFVEAVCSNGGLSEAEMRQDPFVNVRHFHN